MSASTANQTSQVSEWLAAQESLDATQGQVDALETSAAVTGFRQKLDLLQRRLVADPRAFRPIFVADGMTAVAHEFRQPELSKAFTLTLWDVLSRDDDASTVMMRFVWDLPVGKKRTFIRAVEAHLVDRYPMFAGLSTSWPAGNCIPPYIRPAEERSEDFDLVNTGYLGYMALGYTRRDVDLFVWLEALRDKQCSDAPCELGALLEGRTTPVGGCPVKIHIPQMFELIGQGRFTEALEMLEASNPLPDVTGRVCPQELQCQGGMPAQDTDVDWAVGVVPA